MGNPPAFQLYAADFYMDTASWTATEVGSYFRLLLHEWINGPLPNDMMALSRIAGVDHKTMRKFWGSCMGKKFIQNGKGAWENSRLENTRKEQEEYRKNQIESGRKGGIKTQEERRQKLSEPSSDASSEIEALQSSPSINIRVSKDTLVCPHQKIIEIYHATVPELPSVQKWTEKRAKHLQTCWSDKNRQSLEWWQGYFSKVRDSDFLMGKSNKFRADLEWLTIEGNLVKVMEGRYANQCEKGVDLLEWARKSDAADAAARKGDDKR